MKRAAVIDLEDAKIILEVLRNEKITEEYNITEIGEIYRVKGVLEWIIYQAEKRAVLFEAREAMV